MMGYGATSVQDSITLAVSPSQEDSGGFAWALDCELDFREKKNTWCHQQVWQCWAGPRLLCTVWRRMGSPTCILAPECSPLAVGYEAEGARGTSGFDSTQA